MNEITNTVTMNLEDFLAMRDNEENFYMLLDAILDGSELGYYDDGIRYSNDNISAALKFIAPERYNERVKTLKFLKDAKKED